MHYSAVVAALSECPMMLSLFSADDLNRIPGLQLNSADVISSRQRVGLAGTGMDV